MHTLLFQGLNFMEGSVFGITLQKILELLSQNVIAITQGINFVGIMKLHALFARVLPHERPDIQGVDRLQTAVPCAKAAVLAGCGSEQTTVGTLVDILAELISQSTFCTPVTMPNCPKCNKPVYFGKSVLYVKPLNSQISDINITITGTCGLFLYWLCRLFR